MCCINGMTRRASIPFGIPVRICWRKPCRNFTRVYRFGIGPAIENGFYYDVDPGDTPIKEADLPAIEKKMMELAARKEPVVRKDIAKGDALKGFWPSGERRISAS